MGGFISSVFKAVIFFQISPSLPPSLLSDLGLRGLRRVDESTILPPQALLPGLDPLPVPARATHLPRNLPRLHARLFLLLLLLLFLHLLILLLLLLLLLLLRPRLPPPSTLPASTSFVPLSLLLGGHRRGERTRTSPSPDGH